MTLTRREFLQKTFAMGAGSLVTGGLAGGMIHNQLETSREEECQRIYKKMRENEDFQSMSDEQLMSGIVEVYDDYTKKASGGAAAIGAAVFIALGKVLPVSGHERDNNNKPPPPPGPGTFEA